MISAIVKLDEDRHLVFGWASVISENGTPLVDSQGDVISEPELETAAYDFVATSRKAGAMHEKIGVGKLIEAMMFTKEKQKALGIDLGRVGFWCGFKIDDEEVWKRIKSGDLGAFSIHGRARRVEA